MKTHSKIEHVNGRLLQHSGKWKVQSGYGTFPLCEALQGKPDASSHGAWVSADVSLGQVVNYHFQDGQI
jgi:hypothetical protein